MKIKDYFKTLGIERTASGEDIKKAYHKLVLKYHPDSNKNKLSHDANEKLKEVNEAYQILGDLDSRLKYMTLVNKDIKLIQSIEEKQYIIRKKNGT